MKVKRKLLIPSARTPWACVIFRVPIYTVCSSSLFPGLWIYKAEFPNCKKDQIVQSFPLLLCLKSLPD